MPKSPTARLGIPRYEDSETAAFSFQVNAISEAVDAKAELRLVSRPLEVSAVAVAQDRIIFRGAGGPYTATLPVPAAEARVAVLNETATKECKIKVNTGLIYGDFVTGVTEITLSVGQHVELVSDGTNWFIVAGEPKRVQTYGVLKSWTLAEAEAGQEPSATRLTMVSLTITSGSNPWADLSVGGVKIGEIAVGLTAVSFLVPPGQKWKVALKSGTAPSWSTSYLPL